MQPKSDVKPMKCAVWVPKCRVNIEKISIRWHTSDKAEHLLARRPFALGAAAGRGLTLFQGSFTRPSIDEEEFKDWRRIRKVFPEQENGDDKGDMEEFYEWKRAVYFVRRMVAQLGESPVVTCIPVQSSWLRFSTLHNQAYHLTEISKLVGDLSGTAKHWLICLLARAPEEVGYVAHSRRDWLAVIYPLFSLHCWAFSQQKEYKRSRAHQLLLCNTALLILFIRNCTQALSHK